MTTASAILRRAEGKAAPAASPTAAPPDIAKVAKPAPGASPVGAFAYLEGDDGTQAWIVKDGDKVTGYLRDASQPTRAIEIDDAKAWSGIVDQLGLTEQAVPTSDAAGADAAPPDAPPDAPQTPPVPPAAAPQVPDQAAAPADAQTAPDSGRAAPARPPVPPQKQPPTQSKAAPGGQVIAPADHEEQTGIMIALMVPEGDAQDLALDIPTAEDPTCLHLTLAFLGTTDAVDDEGAFYANVLDALREVAAEYEPVSGQVSGVGRFSIDGGEDAFVYLFDSPGLSELRHDVVEALEENGLTVSDEHGFTPHITIAYLKQGEDNPIRRAESKVLAFDALTFCFGDQRLNIRLGGDDPDEADAEFTLDATGGYNGSPDSTAPAAQIGRKGLPPQFRKTKNGKNKAGKRGGPPIAAGSFVAWGNQRGKVDLIVTNGKVPGVEEDITGTNDKPAARVSVMAPGAGGKLKATGKKVGVAVASLKRSAPFAFGKKDLPVGDPDAALVDLLATYYEAVEVKELAVVDPAAVNEVYDRGWESWPGERCGTSNAAWALGRTKAFLTVAAGQDVPGYEADRDLLPDGHALAVKSAALLTVTNDGGPERVLAPEEKVAGTVAEGQALNAETLQSVLDGLRDALRPTPPLIP